MRRTLAHFLLIGALLFGARWLLFGEARAARPELRVHVSAQASETEIRGVVDEALLLELAIQSGWARSDPVVRHRLVRNLKLVTEAARSKPAEAIDSAIALGMHRSDPLARRRLIDQARRALVKKLAPVQLNDDALRAFVEQHRDRFVQPRRLRFSHVLLSSSRRGRGLLVDARALVARLESLTPSQAIALSDPFLHGHQLGPLAKHQIDGKFGAGFFRQLSRAPQQRWSGPLRSSYGLHFVWVHDKIAARLPPLAKIRAAVARAFLEQTRERQLRAALDELRQSYDISLQRGLR